MRVKEWDGRARARARSREAKRRAVKWQESQRDKEAREHACAHASVCARDAQSERARQRMSVTSG